MKKIIKELEGQINFRESDYKKGYLNEYGKGVRDGLIKALNVVKKIYKDEKHNKC